MKSLKRALVFLCLALVPALSNASIDFDFSGVCEANCAQLGLVDGEAFTIERSLRLVDGADISAGSVLTIDQVESFEINGIDYRTGGTFYEGYEMRFSEYATIESFVTVAVNSTDNVFCYQAALNPDACAGGFVTRISTGPVSFALTDGSGVGQFSLHTHEVPLPAAAPLFISALTLIAALRRRKQ